jgi:hypothetical protein
MLWHDKGHADQRDNSCCKSFAGLFVPYAARRFQNSGANMLRMAALTLLQRQSGKLAANDEVGYPGARADSR